MLRTRWPRTIGNRPDAQNTIGVISAQGIQFAAEKRSALANSKGCPTTSIAATASDSMNHTHACSTKRTPACRIRPRRERDTVAVSEAVRVKDSMPKNTPRPAGREARDEAGGNWSERDDASDQS